MRLEIESRHSDWGEDAGGYSVLRFENDWVGRVTDHKAGARLLEYVRRLEEIALSALALKIAVEHGYPPNLSALSRDLDAMKERFGGMLEGSRRTIEKLFGDQPADAPPDAQG